MSFQPQIPLTGIAGWRFLQRTQESQQATFEQGAALRREVEYFAENIGKVTSAADLVADRRLLKVALGAFGLEGEIDKRAFVRKVLESDTTDPASFASRMTEQGYKKLAKAFGFGDPGGARTDEPGLAGTIIADYKTRAFEVAVGESNNDMRLALNFRREMAELSAGGGKSWFNVLGSKPLREVVEKAFGLPSQFAKLDIDRQRDILAEKSGRLFGTEDLTAFQDPANVEKVLARFLARAQIEAGAMATGPAANALALLQANASGSQGLLNLIAARG